MLKNTFCSSPWFHIGINPQGNYIPCRWDFSGTISEHNISNTSLTEYINSSLMKQFRLDLLDGKSVDTCKSCYYEDKNNKVSGRQRQLLKSAITVEIFDKSFCASPQYSDFEYSYNNQGKTQRQPIDLQLDLGSTCNSSCIMCGPIYSTKLANDYIKLHQIEPTLFEQPTILKNWSDDQKLVDKLVDELGNLPIRYVHFLGGETLYLKSFYNICNRLIEQGTNKTVSLGTTTNCTVYSQELAKIITEFSNVHLGLSIESFHRINDYVRYPSTIDQCRSNIDKFLDLRAKTNLHLALRITPNILTIFHIDTVFRFMLDNQITAESCNILQEPSCLRIELLPQELADQILEKINDIISEYDLKENTETIINRRNEQLIDPIIRDVIFEYKHFLETYKQPENVEEERYNLVKFLKAFESLRSNTILDYLPEYEEFLRQYNY